MKARCEQLGEAISAWIDGEATPQEVSTVEAHLRTCATCRRRADDWRQLQDQIPTEVDATWITDHTLRKIAARRRLRPRLILVAALATGLGVTTVLASLPAGDVDAVQLPTPAPPVLPGSMATRPPRAPASTPPAPEASATLPSSTEKRPPLGHVPIPCAKEGERRATDAGVSATTVNLAMTAPLDGPMRSLIQPTTTAVKMAVDRINETGGVCGRHIALQIVNDSGDAAKGREYIRSFAESGDVFALVAMPSWRGLRAAIDAGDIDQAEIPVVGTTGMSQSEFSSPWVFPIGPSSQDFGDIIVRHAYERGARRFAVVWDAKLTYAVEGRKAIVKAIRSREAVVAADVPLDPAQASYATEVNQFNHTCEEGCDAVVLLLLPDAAVNWMSKRPVPPKVETSMSPLLLSDDFAERCTRVLLDDCHDLIAWTGFRRDRDRTPLEQSAYYGTFLLADAMGRVGVDLTRDGLKGVLDSQEFESAVTGGPLRWPMNRRANHWMRAYSIVTSNGDFRRWREMPGWQSSQT